MMRLCLRRNVQIVELFSEPGDGDNQASVYPRVCTTSLRDNYRYSRDYLLIANFIVMAFIPFLLLIIFNSLTFRIIRNSSLTNDRTSNRQRRDLRIAKMFILIIIVFFICNMPRMILNAFDVSLGVPLNLTRDILAWL